MSNVLESVPEEAGVTGDVGTDVIEETIEMHVPSHDFGVEDTAELAEDTDSQEIVHETIEEVIAPEPDVMSVYAETELDVDGGSDCLLRSPLRGE